MTETNFARIVKQEKQFHVRNCGHFTSCELGNFANFNYTEIDAVQRKENHYFEVIMVKDFIKVVPS